MKKVAVIFVLAFVLLAGCTVTDPDASLPAESTEAVTEKVTETPEATESLSNAATVGDYYVEIKLAKLTEDYEGNPAVIITYSWTNNSEETRSAISSVSCFVFQDGVSLDRAFIVGSDIYDSGSSRMDRVRPGATIDVQEAYVLRNTESMIEVEVGEWLTLESDPPKAYMTFDLTQL